MLTKKQWKEIAPLLARLPKSSAEVVPEPIDATLLSTTADHFKSTKPSSTSYICCQLRRPNAGTTSSTRCDASCG